MIIAKFGGTSVADSEAIGANDRYRTQPDSGAPGDRGVRPGRCDRRAR